MKLVLLPGDGNQYVLSVDLNKDNHIYKIEEAIKVINEAIDNGKQISYVSFYNSLFANITKESLLPLFLTINDAKVKRLGLVSINLNNMETIEIQGILDFVVDLCKAGTVERVEFSRNFIGDASLEQQCVIVERLLKIISHIQNLDLSFNHLQKLQGDLLSDLLVGCAQSRTLRTLNLNYNQLVHQIVDKERKHIDEKLLSLLFNFRGETHNWEYLSLSGTDLGFLSYNGWNVFLDNVEKCCRSIDLSHNLLQEQTNEGLLEVYEKQDLMQIMINWLATTKLNMIDLTCNEFSIRNTKLLEGSIRGGKILIEEGNNLPDSLDYDRLLQQAKEIEDLEKEEFVSNQNQPSPTLFYMQDHIVLQAQQSDSQINSSDLEEQVVVFMQNLATKDPAVSQKIPMQDMLEAITDVFVSHNMNVTPLPSSGIIKAARVLGCQPK